MSGKGSNPRPYSVPLETFGNNFDAIFRKNKKSDKEKNLSKYSLYFLYFLFLKYPYY